MSYKIYVDVLAKFNTDGVIKPLEITWSDGRVYEVDRVLDTRQAASLKTGGNGIRYTCMIRGRETYIWREGSNKWFVEGK